MGKPTARAASLTAPAQFMMETGLTTSNMERELRSGTKARSSTLETSLRARRLERVSLCLMALDMMVTLLMESSTVMVSTTSPTQVKSTKEASRITTCPETES